MTTLRFASVLVLAATLAGTSSAIAQTQQPPQTTESEQTQLKSRRTGQPATGKS